jgi:hypothetical protein
MDVNTYPMASVAVSPTRALFRDLSDTNLSSRPVRARFAAGCEAATSSLETFPDAFLFLLILAFVCSSFWASSTIALAFSTTPSVESGMGRSGCEAGIATVTDVRTVSMEVSLFVSTVSSTWTRTVSSFESPLRVATTPFSALPAGD